MARLKETYQNEIAPAMQKKFGYKNVMQIPKLDKIVINMGVGEAKENAKALESAVKDMEIIAGRSRLSRRLRSPSRTSRSGRGLPSDVRLHCAAAKCMSSQTV